MAFPWRHRDRAQEMGRAVAEVLDALPGAGRRGAGQRRRPSGSRAAEPGAGAAPRSRPRIPVVAVTGTNGKTTTSPDDRPHRPHRTASSSAGRTPTASTSTASWSRPATTPGPSGAGRVLAHQQVELAVTETARGGILLKGIGLTRNDVSVVTNVTADHLGLQGIDTLDQLAEVKARRPADHPQATAGRCSTATTRGSSRCAASIQAQPWVFSRDPDSPAIREVLDRRRPGHHRHRRLGLGARRPTPTPTRWSSWSTCR